MGVLQLLLVPVLGLALFGAGAAKAEAPVTIRVAWVSPHDLAPLMAAAKDILKYDGKTYKLEAVHFRGTPAQINALATGGVDIGFLGFTSLPLAIQNAHLTDLRVIVDEMQDGAKGYASNEFLVGKDSAIKSIADLKGKVLATNALGSAVDVAMDIGLRRNGINSKTDVNVVETAFPTMKSMLLSGKAELVTGILPFQEDPELKAKSRVLFTERDAMGGPSDLGIWVARKGFIEKHHAAVVDLLSDYLRALHFFLDPQNHEKAVKIAADFSKLPTKAYESWLFTDKSYFHAPNGVPSSALLQSNVDTLVKYGYLKKKIDMAKYVDASLIEEAAKSLE
jgi:NitT/TauT family transport system substrate-binding protein